MNEDILSLQLGTQRSMCPRISWVRRFHFIVIPSFIFFSLLTSCLIPWCTKKKKKPVEAIFYICFFLSVIPSQKPQTLYISIPMAGTSAGGAVVKNPATSFLNSKDISIRQTVSGSEQYKGRNVANAGATSTSYQWVPDHFQLTALAFLCLKNPSMLRD